MLRKQFLQNKNKKSFKNNKHKSNSCKRQTQCDAILHNPYTHTASAGPCCSMQITMPSPHRSVFFYGVKALKAIQSTEANSFIIHVQKKLNTKYLTPGWVSTSECFFWYWLTRVVPDKWPLNGCCCCCTLHHRCITTLSYKNIRQLSAVSYILELKSCIQCFDAIGQLSGRAFML